MAELFRILSIDGGGIRGLIPAMVLSRIEEDTGTPIWKLFDLIAGTSTGGILAAALTIPADPVAPADARSARYTARDLVDMYTKNAATIFPYPPPPFRHTDLDFVLHSRYHATGVESVLKDYCGTSRLREALTPVLITSYDIERSRAWFFSSQDATTRPDTHDFPTWEVARATSSAPLYFPPMKLATSGPESYFPLVDGGVAANNPAMCAYVEAICAFNQDPGRVLVASLGTGELQQPVMYDAVQAGGIAQWGMTPINLLFDGNQQTVQYQMDALLNRDAHEPRYFRFQTALSGGTNEMDNAHPDNIRQLIDLGGSLADASKDALHDLYHRLGL
ncbi:MAG TPA: patatin-like phospholipase family protein [Thermomicrobiaceae bacterium]|nr:patatin-like phospholipase family protein [Thermomicrobiaceae bacterium]